VKDKDIQYNWKSSYLVLFSGFTQVKVKITIHKMCTFVKVIVLHISVKEEMFSFCWLICLSVNVITQNVVDEWMNAREHFGRGVDRGIRNRFHFADEYIYSSLFV